MSRFLIIILCLITLAGCRDKKAIRKAEHLLETTARVVQVIDVEVRDFYEVKASACYHDSLTRTQFNRCIAPFKALVARVNHVKNNVFSVENALVYWKNSGDSFPFREASCDFYTDAADLRQYAENLGLDLNIPVENACSE